MLEVSLVYAARIAWGRLPRRVRRVRTGCKKFSSEQETG